MNTAYCIPFDDPKVRELIQQDLLYSNLHIYIDMRKIDTMFLCDLIKFAYKNNTSAENYTLCTCTLVMIIDEKKYIYLPN